MDEIIDKVLYNINKNDISKKIRQCKEHISHLDNNGESRLEINENLFDFILRAKTNFNHGDLKIKRKKFSSLGQNFILK